MKRLEDDEIFKVYRIPNLPSFSVLYEEQIIDIIIIPFNIRLHLLGLFYSVLRKLRLL